MKNSYLLFLLVFLSFQQNTFAQNAEGCDGVRYFYDIFSESDIVERTETYGSNQTADGNTISLEMDVYHSENDDVEKRPLIIWAHGGAFVTGDRGDMEPICRIYAKKGFVNATMSYRLYPVLTLGIPDSVRMLDAAIRAIGDMKAAVRYFREDAANLNKYNIDPDRIYVGGASAGALMAVQVGYLDSLDNIPDYFTEILTINGDLEGSTGDAENQSYPSNVQGVISLAGGVHRLDWIQQNDIPIMSYHGDVDDVVPYNHGLTSVFNIPFMSINGSGSIHRYIENQNLNIPNLLTTAIGADHETAFGVEYEDELNNFIDDAQVFLYNLLCAGIAIDVNELLESKVIKAAPNPSSESILLELPSFSEIYDLTVYNMSGQLVFQDRRQRTRNYELQKAKIGKGLFFVTIKMKDKVEVLKIIFE